MIIGQAITETAVLLRWYGIGSIIWNGGKVYEAITYFQLELQLDLEPLGLALALGYQEDCMDGEES